MKKSLLLLLFHLSIAYSQESKNTSGGNAIGSGGSASYSVGQITYSTYTGLNGSVSEGVQQSFEIFLSTSNFDEVNAISLYPNPTTNQLFLSVTQTNNDLKYVLVNIAGKILLSDKISQLNTVLNLENFSEGIYMLTIASEDNSKQKIYKIIKND